MPRRSNKFYGLRHCKYGNGGPAITFEEKGCDRRDMKAAPMDPLVGLQLTDLPLAKQSRIFILVEDEEAPFHSSHLVM